LGIGQVEAARDVSAPNAGPKLRLFPLESLRGAGVHHLLGPALDIRAHRGEVPQLTGIEPGGEAAGRRPCDASLQGPPLRLPFAESAIEHRNSTVAEHPEHPPDARSA